MPTTPRMSSMFSSTRKKELAELRDEVEILKESIRYLDLRLSRFSSDRIDHAEIHRELETLVKEWKEVKVGARAHL